MAAARILIIEDNHDNLELVRFLLHRGGYETLMATNGREGFDLARSEHPDLILLDLTIPEVDGWKLASWLKSDPATQGIKVVALTAHTLPSDRKKAFEAGCDGYITKPLDIYTFNQTIADYLKA